MTVFRSLVKTLYTSKSKIILYYIYIHKEYEDEPKTHSLVFFFFFLCSSVDFIFLFIRFFVRLFDDNLYKKALPPPLVFFVLEFLSEFLKIF